MAAAHADKGSYAGSEQGDSVGWLRARIDAFLAWPYVRKATLLSAVVLFFFASYGLLAMLVRSNARLHALVEPAVLDLFSGVAWSGAAMWAVLTAWGLWLSRRGEGGRVYPHAVVQTYAFLNMALGFCVGPFTAVTWLVILGSFAAGLLVFDSRLILTGAAVSFVTFASAFAAWWLGWIPFEPLLEQVRAPNGELEPVYLASRSLLLLLFAGIFIAILTYTTNRLREQQRRLEDLSRSDTLTGTCNRRHLLDVADTELARCRREGAGFALILLDLDGFKEINDTRGHVFGDELLRRVGQTLRESVRRYDTIGRYGGDEFVVLAPGASLSGGLDIAQRCVDAIQRIDISSGQAQRGLTAGSGGVAVFPAREVETTQDLLRAADEALYRAKANGRNRVVAAAQTTGDAE